MGYPQCSPIANFGMPPATGAVWDGPNQTSHDNVAMQKLIWLLPVDDVIILTVYYVKTHCNARQSGRILEKDGKTVRSHVERIQSRLLSLQSDNSAHII